MNECPSQTYRNKSTTDTTVRRLPLNASARRRPDARPSPSPAAHRRNLSHNPIEQGRLRVFAADQDQQTAAALQEPGPVKGMGYLLVAATLGSISTIRRPRAVLLEFVGLSEAVKDIRAGRGVVPHCLVEAVALKMDQDPLADPLELKSVAPAE